MNWKINPYAPKGVVDADSKTPHKHLEIKGLNKWILAFLILLLIIFVVRYLNTHYVTLPVEALNIISTIAIFASSYFVAALFVRISVKAGSRMFSGSEHIEHRLIFRKLYISGIYFVATAFALWKLGMSISNLTVFLGLATTGLAFAVRDIIVSYFVWFMLLSKKPFRIGDYIKIGDDEGRVMYIGSFYVVLDDSPQRAEDYTRVPNRRFLDLPFYNYGKDELLCQVFVPLDNLPSDIDVRLERIKKDLEQEHPKPIVMLDTHNNRVCVFLQTYTKEQSRRSVRDALLRAVVRELGAKNTSSKTKRRVNNKSSKTVPNKRNKQANRKASKNK